MGRARVLGAWSEACAISDLGFGTRDSEARTARAWGVGPGLRHSGLGFWTWDGVWDLRSGLGSRFNWQTRTHVLLDFKRNQRKSTATQVGAEDVD